MNLGTMATGVSREWMSTPAKKRTHGSWKRTRGETAWRHSTIAAGALKHQRSQNHRHALEECDHCTSFESDAVLLRDASRDPATTSRV